MHVILADTLITVIGWLPSMDPIGEYRLTIRKTPLELKEEKARYTQLYGRAAHKVSPVRHEYKTVIDKDPESPNIAYFLPGLWPRVSEYLEQHNITYTLEDKRNPEIRPEIDYSKLTGVSFRENQDVALALISKLDCGIIETATAWGKCESPDTEILMYDGTIKKVKDIVVGDKVMGPDSTPRTVLRTTSGVGKMYKYIPTKGTIHHFTADHTLSLIQCSSRHIKYNDKVYCKGDVLDIPIRQYIVQSAYFKHCFKAFRTGPLHFAKRKSTELNPYFVGVYLGDGTSLMDTTRSPRITNNDDEVLDYCVDYATKMGWTPTVGKQRECRFISLHKAKDIIRRNTCTATEKRILPAYKYGSIAVRRSVLAGLLDTDGYAYGNIYEICTKFDGLAEDILFVARSIGLAAYDNYCEKACVTTGAVGMYHRIKISGDCSALPIKVQRKRVNRTKNKNVLHTGFILEEEQYSEYCGFELDGDNRFVLGDFTVTHNSFLISVICKVFPSLNILVCTSSSTVVATLCDYLRKQLPGEVGKICGGCNTAVGKRVVVSTLKSLPKIDPINVQLVLVDEC